MAGNISLGHESNSSLDNKSKMNKSMIQVLEKLEKSEKGKELLGLAVEMWSRQEGLKSDPEKLNANDSVSITHQWIWLLESKIKWGNVSKTDATIIRQFDPISGKEVRLREVNVYIKFRQTLDFAVIDLAHELTHAVSNPVWDPYDSELTVGKYVWHAIEGEGGEIDAVMNECIVLSDLQKFKVVARLPAFKHCEGWRENGELGQNKIHFRSILAKNFYKVGEFQDQLINLLKNEFKDFPYLSNDPPSLFSSTANAPYPVALVREFQDLNKIACGNSRKRIDKIGFTLSAVAAEAQKKLYDFVKSRCQNGE